MIFKKIITKNLNFVCFIVGGCKANDLQRIRKWFYMYPFRVVFVLEIRFCPHHINKFNAQKRIQNCDSRKLKKNWKNDCIHSWLLFRSSFVIVELQKKLMMGDCEAPKFSPFRGVDYWVERYSVIPFLRNSVDIGFCDSFCDFQ